MPPECHCPLCTWEGNYADCQVNVRQEQYGDAFGSPVWKEEYDYWCPDCSATVEEGPGPLEPELDLDNDDEDEDMDLLLTNETGLADEDEFD